KQTGGRGKFAVIYCKFEPMTKDQIEEWTAYQEEQGEKKDPNNIYFLDKIVGGVVPKEYIPSVEQGFREATVKGAKYGFQCVDLRGATSGTASFTMEPSHYAPVREELADLRQAS